MYFSKLNKAYLIYILTAAFLMISCSKEKSQSEADHKSKTNITLFKKVSPSVSNIDFVNTILEDEEHNIFVYHNFTNGGAVAVGDINNDGLQDIYFTANQNENKLFLNKGNMVFEDITTKARVEGDNFWYAGATFVDINNDGLLDLYLCKAGLYRDRVNELYVNNGDLTFTEKASEYRIADNGFTTHATFFDSDNDGDLDLYVLNHPPFATRGIKVKEEARRKPDAFISDQFYRNEGNGKFVIAGNQVGIPERLYAYGLSVTASDLNNDGWTDLYITNDYSEPDLLYFNNGDGTFKESIKQSTKHIPAFGMGADIADFNNDLFADILALDMMPEDNRRKKTEMGGMKPEAFWNHVELGYHYQYMQNVLHLNNGTIDNGLATFSDVAPMAGVSDSDWSWSALFADFDNDGWKDLFVTTGFLRGLRNNDFINAVSEKRRRLNNTELLTLVPSEKLVNYVYKNNRDLTFSNKIKEWGVEYPGYSNGAAYADLDNDGDLDFIINNINDTSLVYENRANTLEANNFIQFSFDGRENNKFGIGTKVIVKSGDIEQLQELTLSRGFQSSVPPLMHFGLGQVKKVDEIEITWLGGKKQLLTNITANQKLVIKESESKVFKPAKKVERIFSDVTRESNIKHRHIENEYDDFKVEVLLPHKMSNFGPGISVGDINGDELEDFFVGGAMGQSGALFIQQKNGTFKKMTSLSLDSDKKYEDMGAALFDANGNGFLDLYVVSGGNEYKSGSDIYQDRLYLNNGKGRLVKAKSLPKITSSGSCVRPADFDDDGDMDLLIGGRLEAQKYPYPGKTILLKNTGNENDIPIFRNVTKTIAPDLENIGMVTDAIWTDFNGDEKSDLIIVGEWMEPRFFLHKNGKFSDVSENTGLTNTMGWWFSVNQGDIDNDGDTDYIAGNLGLNYKYKATPEESFRIYANDFDNNGTSDIVLGYFFDSICYPVRGRECSSQQIPGIERKFTNYESFANASIIEVYGKENLNNSLLYEAKNFSTSYIENKGNGKFQIHSLCLEAQRSSVNSIIIKDFNQDGNLDLVLAGNLYASEIETLRNDASIGLYLEGNGQGNFSPIPFVKSGLMIPNDVKEIAEINTVKGKTLLVANNNDYLQAIKFKFPSSE